MRAVVHLAAGLALAALAFTLGRWLRDPQPGGPLILLLAAGLPYALALRRLYGAGGLGRRAQPAAVAPPPPLPDERLDLNTASAVELQRLPGIGPVGAGRIVEERELGGPYRSVGDLVRVGGFGPERVRGLGGRVRV